VTAPQRKRRSDATRSIERLTATAREVFAERGHDVALDEIAKRAGVGNATLYRHFPTRGDLLIAVYSEEVQELCRRGTDLLAYPDPVLALRTWLDHFVVHVATKRTLALAAVAGASTERGAHFAGWHDSMISTASALLGRASDGIHPDVTARDLLAVANGAALAGADLEQSHRILRLAWDGLARPTPEGNASSGRDPEAAP
jgi:AcrR family transcriptional regulator